MDPPPPPPLGPTPPDAFASASGRLDALDVFRGATVAGMMVVNTPGDWGHAYPPLLHADWHGWTPTDTIFPFFLFIVGVSIAFSFSLPQIPKPNSRQAPRTQPPSSPLQTNGWKSTA